MVYCLFCIVSLIVDMIYIISDIHGLYSRYEKMLEKINFSDDDFLYVLGDVIDRGDRGIDILLDLMEKDNVEMFLGNHEHMMLTYLNNLDNDTWFYRENGGQITFSNFSLLDKKTRNRIVDYLYNSTIVKNIEINNKKYILSHTGVWLDNDLYTKDFKDNIMDVQRLVWNMYPYDLASLDRYDKTDEDITLVSGHIITRNLHDSDEVYIRSFNNGYTWIDIDCGCAMSEKYGYLSCLSINEEGEIDNIYYVK